MRFVFFVFLLSESLCVLLLASHHELDKSINTKNENTEIIEDEKKSSENSKKIFFPSWKKPDFSLNIDPSLSYRFDSSITKEKKEYDFAFEGGAHLDFLNFPIIESDYFVLASPSLSYFLGHRSKGLSSELKESRFQRYYYTIALSFLIRYFRYDVKLTRGRLHYKKIFESLESLNISNEFAISILSSFSFHYLTEYSKIESLLDKHPKFKELSHWFYFQKIYNFLNFRFRIGPRLSSNTFYDQVTFSSNEFSTFSIKADSRLDFIWNIGFRLKSSYIFNSSFSLNDNNVFPDLFQIPTNNLNIQNHQQFFPKDSFYVSTFFGVDNLFLGMGLGWQYNLFVLNFSNIHDHKYRKMQTNGFNIFFNFPF